MYRGSITLRVLMNDILVGMLEKKSTGAIFFWYDQTWLDNPNAIPVSLSLPLSTRAYTGARVSNYFDNLLPDVDYIRKTIAEKVGAQGTDAFSLLEKIGGDCVGALQFLPEYQEKEGRSELVECSDSEIAHILRNLTISPLGIESDGEFRISLAGAQEKTALYNKTNSYYF